MKMAFNNVAICDKIESFYVFLKIIMTKADWLDFLKPSMVVQRLKKKLLQHLQLENSKTIPQLRELQRNQHLPMYKKRQFKELQPNQSLQLLKRLQLKKRNHNQHLLALRSSSSRSSSSTRFCKCSKQPQDKLYRISISTSAGFANAQAGQQAAFANGQPLQPGQNVQFINGQAVVVPAQPSAFGTTFKTIGHGC